MRGFLCVHDLNREFAWWRRIASPGPSDLIVLQRDSRRLNGLSNLGGGASKGASPFLISWQGPLHKVAGSASPLGTVGG